MTVNRPLTPAAQSALDDAIAQVSSLPMHLFTPRQWAERALMEGLELAGTPEGAEKTAECKRYLACQEALARLAARVAELVLALKGAALPGPEAT